MAIGLPVKANYAAGDILTATNMNDLSGTFNEVATSYSQAAGKNKAINGGFDIWQRGTTQSYTGAAASGFIADRWASYTTNSGTASRDTTLIQADSQYALRWTSTTASGGNLFLQSIETANAVQLAGKTVTLTCWVAGTVGKSPSIGLGYSTTTDLGPINAFTDITATSGTTTVTSSGAYQKLSAVFAIPSTAKTIRINLATGTLNNAEYINFSQCQLELSSVATAFTRTGGTIQGELAACQRYYFRTSGTAAYYSMAQGVSDATTSAKALFQWPVTLRTASTDITYGNLYWEEYQGTASVNPTVTAGGASNNVARLSLTGMTGLTAGRVGYLFSNNNSSSYIAVNAEL